MPHKMPSQTLTHRSGPISILNSPSGSPTSPRAPTNTETAKHIRFAPATKPGFEDYHNEVRAYMRAMDEPNYDARSVTQSFAAAPGPAHAQKPAQTHTHTHAVSRDQKLAELVRRQTYEYDHRARVYERRFADQVERCEVQKPQRMALVLQDPYNTRGDADDEDSDCEPEWYGRNGVLGLCIMGKVVDVEWEGMAQADEQVGMVREGEETMKAMINLYDSSSDNGATISINTSDGVMKGKEVLVQGESMDASLCISIGSSRSDDIEHVNHQPIKPKSKQPNGSQVQTPTLEVQLDIPTDSYTFASLINLIVAHLTYNLPALSILTKAMARLSSLRSPTSGPQPAPVRSPKPREIKRALRKEQKAARRAWRTAPPSHPPRTPEDKIAEAIFGMCFGFSLVLFVIYLIVPLR